MKRDRIFRRRRENEKKEEIEETMGRGVEIEIKKIRRNKVSSENKVDIGINEETEGNIAKEQGSKLREEGEGIREGVTK